jgi:hypothetical protein
MNDMFDRMNLLSVRRGNKVHFANAILFPGSIGIMVSLAIFLIFAVSLRLTTEKGPFDFDPEFEKQLTVYLDIAKFVLGLASGSIVLIVTASTLRANTTTAAVAPPKLPVSYASPMAILVMTIFYGVLFMAFLALAFEAFKADKRSYTRPKYVLNQTLAFSSLACFCLGYGWLAFAAIHS